MVYSRIYYRTGNDFFADLGHFVRKLTAAKTSEGGVMETPPEPQKPDPHSLTGADTPLGPLNLNLLNNGPIKRGSRGT